MQIDWTMAALSDLARLYDFLQPLNPNAAARTVQSLTAALEQLSLHPRLGEELEEFQPREIRIILIGQYEMRYEIQSNSIYILRIWHTREDR